MTEFPGAFPQGWRRVPFREFQQWLLLAGDRRRERAVARLRDKTRGGA